MADEKGQLIGTTQIYELGHGESREDFVSRLRNNLNNMVIAINDKESGLLSQEEILNGQLFYPDYTAVNSATTTSAQYRQVYRKVIPTGTLPNAGTSNTAHGLTFLPAAGNTTYRAIDYYGAATDPAGRIMIKLPYSSPTLNQNISVHIDATNVVITTGINRTAFTDSHVVIEYIKL